MNNNKAYLMISKCYSLIWKESDGRYGQKLMKKVFEELYELKDLNSPPEDLSKYSKPTKEVLKGLEGENGEEYKNLVRLIIAEF
jgi:hypothetical protein